MKNLISKAVLLLLCSTFAFSSCSKDDSEEKKTATVTYRIIVNGERDYVAGATGSGIVELHDYIEKEMDAVSKEHDKDAWEITETADTEEAAIAACDKKAIAIFDAKLPAMDAASALVKKKFDAKKAELLPKITLEPIGTRTIHKDYGAILQKGNNNFNMETVKESKNIYELKAVGGDK